MAADFAKPANAELVQLQIDPHELGGVFRLMTAKSFQVYKNTWLDFTQFAGISVEKIPKEEDFARFFEMKRNAGLSGNTIRGFYSHLNKIFLNLYNQRRIHCHFQATTQKKCFYAIRPTSGGVGPDCPKEES